MYVQRGARGALGLRSATPPLPEPGREQVCVPTCRRASAGILALTDAAAAGTDQNTRLHGNIRQNTRALNGNIRLRTLCVRPPPLGDGASSRRETVPASRRKEGGGERRAHKSKRRSAHTWRLTSRSSSASTALRSSSGPRPPPSMVATLREHGAPHGTDERVFFFFGSRRLSRILGQHPTLLHCHVQPCCSDWSPFTSPGNARRLSASRFCRCPDSELPRRSRRSHSRTTARRVICERARHWRHGGRGC